ncbi:MAG: T9SS type A sorting domain-containing protein [Bacteroidota bacterium]
MQKSIRFSLLAACVFAACCLLYTYHIQTNNSMEASANTAAVSKEFKLPKQQRIDKAIEQEFEKTRDPALNEVPRERLIRARQVADAKRINLRGIDGIKWEERGPNNVAGRTRAILFDANDPTGSTVFAGGVGGGLWKTTNIESVDPNWAPINDFFENIAVSCIAQDPTNPDIIYFGTGEGWFNGDAIRGMGIWKTTDGGDNWSQLGSTKVSDFRYIQKIVINNLGHLFAATRDDGVQRSTNGGASWQKVLGGGTFGSSNRAADLEIAADGDIFASLGIFSTDGIYRSQDNGDTWTDLKSGLPDGDFERIELATAPSNHRYVYALLHDAETNGCKGIYRSVNGGDSWTEVSNPSAFRMSNFARNQAWYDLIAAVDPINPNRLFIGGVDLLVSNDGGQSWRQISQWYGGNGLQYVHADQHAIMFLPGNSNVILFGNDGGVWRTTNGTSTIPTIESRNLGYNVTQYYACAIHPEFGRNEFLAGSQDNGTQQYLNAGMNNTTEVTGGDGAFCHIDKDEPNIQITSYVYNAYRITTNSWNSYSRLNIGQSSGRFINPTDYDSRNNILYGAYENGYYSTVKNVGSSNTRDSTWVPAFNRSKVSAVKVSPNTENLVFFGLSNGDIVRVEDAHVETVIGTRIRNGSGYVSNIDVEIGNDDHIIITYSNYGVNSIWETTNGGLTWVSVEGDLPDMPIRWALFTPGDATKAIVGTELGVWSTDELSASTTEWDPSNTGLANTRIDMLRYRESDFTMIAATHGRGLYSTDHFSPIFTKFETDDFIVAENDPENSTDFCSPYRNIQIPVSINKEPETTITIPVTIDTAASGVNLVNDIILTKAFLNFSPGEPLTDNLELTVFDDAEHETDLEKLVLKMDTSQFQSADPELIVEIRDNDADLDLSDRGDLYQVGNGSASISAGPFGGEFTDGRTQMFYRASDLLNEGLTEGSLTSIAFNILTKGSDRPYENFRIGIKQTVQNQLNFAFEDGFTSVFEGTITTATGWFTIDFDTPFQWDGSSNLIFEICYDDQFWSDDDVVSATNINYLGFLNQQADNATGCILSRPNLEFALPNIRLGWSSNLQVATALGSVGEVYLGNDQTIHIYSADGKLMASVQQIAGNDIGCLDIRVDRSGNGVEQLPWLPGLISRKSLEITSDFNAPYLLTLYFTKAEMLAWGADSLSLSMLRVDDAVSSSDGAGLEIHPNESVIVNSYESLGIISYTDTFTNFSGFALTDQQAIPLPVDLLSFDGKAETKFNQLYWNTANEYNNRGFEVERRLKGGDFEKIGFVAADGFNQSYEFLDTDVSLSGVYYYRLKQLDQNGEFAYSGVIALERAATAVQWQVFPNPSNQFVNLSYEAPNSSSLEVELLDKNGRIIKRLAQVNEKQLTLEFDLKALGLSSGIYFIRLRNDLGLLEHQKLAFYE